MSKQGRAGEAINIAAMASFVGGMVSLIILFSVARPCQILLEFSVPEYFALAITGLTLCISLSSKCYKRACNSFSWIVLGYHWIGRVGEC